jgi:methylthioxylose transferase
MRWRLWLILAIEAALVLLLTVAVRTGLIPLGIRGEWEWMRLNEEVKQPWEWFALALVCVAAYAAFAGVGLRALKAPSSSWVEARWLAALLGASIAVQVAIPVGAPDEYDLTKWAYVNYFHGSTGYFQIAREQAVKDPWHFLARYPQWIRDQDSLHIGTHPPGLIVAQCVLMRTMELSPGLVAILNDFMPPSVQSGFRQLELMEKRPIRRSHRATLYATALLTLFACAGTVVPLYLLARATLPPPLAWIAAALWPLAPAANLFQPDADTTYPLLSTMAWAFAAWAARIQRDRDRLTITGLTLAAASGLVMAFGMMFTLAFLPVGLIVALIVGTDRSLSLATRISLIGATGLGFLAFLLAGWLISGANPFVVWSWNLHHHARFYDEYPRTYWLWLWANGIELAVAIGLPTIVWFVVGMTAPRNVPRVVWATLFVLILVDLTGRNMGEVARLWILYTPPFLIAAASGFERFGGGPRSLSLVTALGGLQTLALQTMIQVVYPV